jgi:hypothetical protein
MTEFRLMMDRFKNIVTRKVNGEEVYNLIREHMSKGEVIIVDFTGIDTMTTYFAKQVFGKLYTELGSEEFDNWIKIDEDKMSPDVDLVLRIGIDGAIATM